MSKVKTYLGTNKNTDIKKQSKSMLIIYFRKRGLDEKIDATLMSVRCLQPAAD